MTGNLIKATLVNDWTAPDAIGKLEAWFNLDNIIFAVKVPVNPSWKVLHAECIQFELVNGKVVQCLVDCATALNIVAAKVGEPNAKAAAYDEAVEAIKWP
ncbi:MAG: hypothetical protein ABIH03_02370 [Pseudomonadota bacterium]